MAHASRTELGAFLGRDIVTEEEGKADIVLDIVSEAIDGHLRGRVASESTKKYAALLAGRRLFLNPDGVTQEILGDWQASYSPTVILSGEEIRLLDNAVGGTPRRRNLSVRTSSDLWADTDVASDIVE